MTTRKACTTLCGNNECQIEYVTVLIRDDGCGEQIIDNNHQANDRSVLCHTSCLCSIVWRASLESTK